MAERNLYDDDVLLGALGQALQATEAGSPAAEALAKSAIELGHVDGELAELVSDSFVDERDRELALRSTQVAEGRALAFEGGGLTLDLDLDPDERTVVGQVAPASPGEVEVIVKGGRLSTTLDPLGRFLLELPRGTVRVVVRTDDGVLTTPWITR